MAQHNFVIFATVANIVPILWGGYFLIFLRVWMNKFLNHGSQVNRTYFLPKIGKICFLKWFALFILRIRMNRSQLKRYQKRRPILYLVHTAFISCISIELLWFGVIFLLFIFILSENIYFTYVFAKFHEHFDCLISKWFTKYKINDEINTGVDSDHDVFNISHENHPKWHIPPKNEIIYLVTYTLPNTYYGKYYNKDYFFCWRQNVTCSEEYGWNVR